MLRRLLLVSVTAFGGAACQPAAAPPGATYDPATGLLLRLETVVDGARQRTYLDGSLPLRTEVDRDADGRVDRWEYLAPDGTLAYVGTSSAGDGVEDTWTWPAAADGERRVAVSLARDRHIDRVEFYAAGVLVRVEHDTNADGRPDKWEAFAGGVLRSVAFDPSGVHGRPDRRLLYDAEGRFSHLEVDPERDGTFVRAASGPRGGDRGNQQ